MKLKFRAEAKDVAVFFVFCMVLLYLVAIAVLNMSSMSNSGEFYGLNPIEAFSSDYIAPTIVFFVLILIIIFSSVSSHFFEREKGVGVKIGSKQADKGYSRWLNEKEMKAELKQINPASKENEYAGIPIINNEKGVWVDNGEYHNLIIGSTGSGKTQVVVHPLVKILAKRGESMIVTDPKGEIYEENAALLRERGYNIILLNFREPQRGNAWNPLNLPYKLYVEGNVDKSNELLDDLARNILYDETSKSQDPFWENASADYFTGLALGLFEDAKEEEINLNSINLMTTIGEEKALGSTYIKEYFSHKNPTSSAYINASGTLLAPADTKGSILSVFKQKIKLFSSRENLSEMLSYSDFDIKDIGRRKTAVFIVVHDEKKTYHSLVTIFIKQAYETLIDVAQENGGKLPFRTNFILDEFANMPPLKDVTTMVTAARSRNIRFDFIIQNFAQLYQIYGKENGDTIKGNCGNLIYLISSELSALEEISKMAGEVKSKEKDKTASTPLVTVSDLQRLKQWETIILRNRMMPFKTKLTPNYKMNWGEDTTKSSYITRDKRMVQVFDLKKFVESKRKSMFDSAGSIMGEDFNKMFGNGFNPSDNKVDLDQILKNIDKQIAQLEEEERMAKETEKGISKPNEDIKVEMHNETKEASINSHPTNLNKFFGNFDDEAVFPIENNIQLEKETYVDKSEKNIVEPVLVSSNISINNVEKDTDSIKTNKNDTIITDDQFFDDFFSDDE